MACFSSCLEDDGGGRRSEDDVRGRRDARWIDDRPVSLSQQLAGIRGCVERALEPGCYYPHTFDAPKNTFNPT